jgi:hypothetical protein
VVRQSLREAPRVVRAYLLFSVVTIAVALARSPKLWEHPVRGAVLATLLVSWVTAIVVWRQRWAWTLMVLVQLSAVLSPAWERWDGPVVYASNLVALALLLSPELRRWVGAVRVGSLPPRSPAPARTRR